MKVKNWIKNKYAKVREEILPSNVGDINEFFESIFFDNFNNEKLNLQGHLSHKVQEDIGDKVVIKKITVLFLPFAKKVVFIVLYNFEGQTGYDVTTYAVVDKKMEIFIHNIIYHIKNNPNFSIDLSIKGTDEKVENVESIVLENVSQSKKAIKKIISSLREAY